MSKKTAVITGALSDISLECLRVFGSKGYKVYFSGCNPSRGKELETKFKADKLDAEFIFADISIEEDVSALLNHVIEKSQRIDVVLNVAGTKGQPATIELSSVEDFHKVFNSNTFGTMLMMKYFLAVMRCQRAGCIINFSSFAGEAGIPGDGVYAASMHAINDLTRTAALEVAKYGVRVNAIAPSPIATDMFDRFVGNDSDEMADFLQKIPTGRIVTPEEIAGVALFLSSDSARSIIAQVIKVDGGYAAGQFLM